MRKALIYSILALFLYNSMGYYLLFEMNRRSARKVMQSAMEIHSARPVMLKIADPLNDKEFRRIDHKEFMYKGELYDIVREIKTGNTTVFICLHDARETKLYAGLKRVNQINAAKAFWNQMSLYIYSESGIDVEPLFSGMLIFSTLDIPLKSLQLPTWSPPPELS